MNGERMMAEPAHGPDISQSTVPDRRFVGALFEGLASRYNGVLLAYSLAQDLRWKAVLVRRLRPQRGQRALDLACGTGLLLDRLSRLLGESHTVGADINRTMLLESRPEAPRRRLIQADAQQLPLAPRTFDIVTAGYLLKYVELDRFFHEIARVLRPGGRIGAYDFSRPVRGTLSGRLYSIYLHRLLPAIGRGRSTRAGAWRTVFEFLPRIAESSGWELRVAHALEGAGFTDVEVVPSLGGAITWVWGKKGAA